MIDARPALTVRLFVKGQLTSRLNGSASRAHWSVISREASKWRHATKIAWLEAGKPTAWGPATVTFTAYVGRLWDDDNLPAAIKACRDEAVRLILGSDDGPKSGLTFRYLQEVRPKAARGVLVVVSVGAP